MSDLPCSKADMERMLREIGFQSVEELFAAVPHSLRCEALLDLPPALCESELLNAFHRIASRNDACTSFLGAGAYSHLAPSLVDHFLLRSEFFTAYTPYQPELSQGTLQAIFEYQTLMAMLTGMDVSNASLYDGATSLVEGVMMALRISRRSSVLVSSAVHPEYRKVLGTYMCNLGIDLKEVPVKADGRTDPDALDGMLSENTAVVALQSPNFFGVIEDLGSVGEKVRASGALLAACVTECFSLGLLKPPGAFDVDIVTGEVQSFGMPLNFGGPYLGFIATREKYMRNLPGRIVGETADAEGRRGFVVTLATREQHIRREKATSNICTNQSLCALAAALYLATLGKSGVRAIAGRCFEKAEFLKSKLTALEGVSLKFDGPTFNEFVVTLPGPAGEYADRLVEMGIVGGLPLGAGAYDKALENCLLTCCTEVHTREEMEGFVHALEKIL